MFSSNVSNRGAMFEKIVLLLFLTAISSATENITNETKEVINGQSTANKEMSRREAILPLIEGFPMHQYTSNQKKIFIKKISKQRYNGQREQKLNRRGRTRLSPNESKRRPHTKRGRLPSKYGAPRSKYPTYPPNVFKKQTNKNKYMYGGARRKPSGKFAKSIVQYFSGPVTKKPVAYKPFKPPTPAGFAEPPMKVALDNYHSRKPTEYDMDSYAEPHTTPNIIRNEFDSYPTKDALSDPEHHLEIRQHPHEQEMAQSWMTDTDIRQIFDNSYAHSKKKPSFIIAQPHGENGYRDYFSLDSYDTSINDDVKSNAGMKKKPIQLLSSKRLNKPWKPSFKEDTNQYLVGGQYAEPPGRYVPKEHNFANKYFRSEDYKLQTGYVGPDLVEYKSTSPYVNYKNGNIAFSPQNLNDAFSIVNK